MYLYSSQGANVPNGHPLLGGKVLGVMSIIHLRACLWLAAESRTTLLQGEVDPFNEVNLFGKDRRTCPVKATQGLLLCLAW